MLPNLSRKRQVERSKQRRIRSWGYIKSRKSKESEETEESFGPEESFKPVELEQDFGRGLQES